MDGMPMEPQTSLCIRDARMLDIAPIFNMIQHGAQQGFFNRRYLQPRYQAGLAMQLFSVRLFGKIRLPDRVWYPARLLTLGDVGGPAGFALVVRDWPAAQVDEIYMCAVAPAFRNKGYGRRLVQSLLDDLPKGHFLQAACLPHAVAMKSLLRSMGFKAAEHRAQPTCILPDGTGALSQGTLMREASGLPRSVRPA